MFPNHRSSPSNTSRPYPGLSDLRIKNWRSIPLAEYELLFFLLISASLYFLTSAGVNLSPKILMGYKFLIIASGAMFLIEKLVQELSLHRYVLNGGILNLNDNNRPRVLDPITQKTLTSLNRLPIPGISQPTNIELITNTAAFSLVYSNTAVQIRGLIRYLAHTNHYQSAARNSTLAPTTSMISGRQWPFAISSIGASPSAPFLNQPSSSHQAYYPFYAKPDETELSQRDAEINYYYTRSNQFTNDEFPEALRLRWNAARTTSLLERVKALFNDYSQNTLCIGNFFIGTNEHTKAVRTALIDYQGESIAGLLMTISRQIGDRKVNPNGTLFQIFRFVMQKFNISEYFVPAIANNEESRPRTSF